MIFILLLTIETSYNYSVILHEFNNRQSCERVAEEIKKDTPSKVTIVTKCIKKE